MLEFGCCSQLAATRVCQHVSRRDLPLRTFKICAPRQLTVLLVKVFLEFFKCRCHSIAGVGKEPRTAPIPDPQRSQ